MIGLQVVEWAAAIIALVWMLYLVIRKPHDVRLRSMTAAVALWVVGYPFGIAASRGVNFVELEPMASRLISHALNATTAYCVMSFFLFSTFEARPAETRARWQALVLVVVIAVLVVSTAMIPVGLRTAAAVLPAQTHPPAHRAAPSIGLFYATTNGYLLYVFATAGLLARRYAPQAEPRLRRALILVMAGAITLSVALSIFVAGDVAYGAGGELPGPVLAVGIATLVPGLILFLVGISYPAAVTRLAALRMWWRHLRDYHTLGALWTMLHAAFPEDALTRVPTSPWRDRATLTGVHRRFYRRTIECRDGLVRLSPYIAMEQSNSSYQNLGRGTELAEQVRHALRAHVDGVVVGTRAIAVAIPATEGLEADVRELVNLARALRLTAATTRTTEKGL